MERTARNIRLLIEYDGGAYVGWQRQPGHPSVQESIETAIHTMLGDDVRLRVAGRTDAGVHARGQVANFHLTHPIADYRIARGLNHLLPRDISIHEAVEVPADFDSKRDSLSKRYRYRLYIARQRAGLETGAWQLRNDVDLANMQEAAQHLLGELDFESFRSSHCDADHARREMFAIDITAKPRPPIGRHVDIVFHANAYCRHMCRILAGTLVEVGEGKRAPGDMPKVIAARDRTKAGTTAPPQGLTLLEVIYPRK